MQEKKIAFFSDQILLKGSLYLPEEFNPTTQYHGLIVCSGYTGLNAIYPKLFAEALTKEDFVVLGYDYRGCGESEGPRGRLLLEEQVRDIRAGVTFLHYQDQARLGAIGLLGWGMGAGLAISAADKNPKVKAVAGVNGFYNGESFLKSAFGEAGYQELLEKIEVDRKERVFKGRYRLTDPFEAYPLDPDTRNVVDERLRPVKNYEIQTSFELGESLLLFDSLAAAARLTQPLFVAHGRKNKLHPLSLAQELTEVVPKSTFYHIAGKHNDFMIPEHPEFKKLTGELAQWFRRRL